jgi:hypothetical protein
MNPVTRQLPSLPLKSGVHTCNPNGSQALLISERQEGGDQAAPLRTGGAFSSACGKMEHLESLLLMCLTFQVVVHGECIVSEPGKGGGLGNHRRHLVEPVSSHLCLPSHSESNREGKYPPVLRPQMACTEALFPGRVWAASRVAMRFGGAASLRGSICSTEQNLWNGQA